MRVGKSEGAPSDLDWDIRVAGKREMGAPNCAAFGHGGRGDQDVFGYVAEYAATERVIFPPYEYIQCRAIFRWFLIFDRGE